MGRDAAQLQSTSPGGRDFFRGSIEFGDWLNDLHERGPRFDERKTRVGDRKRFFVDRKGRRRDRESRAGECSIDFFERENHFFERKSHFGERKNHFRAARFRPLPRFLMGLDAFSRTRLRIPQNRHGFTVKN